MISFLDRLHLPEAVFVGTGAASEAVQATVQVRRTRVVGMVLVSSATEPASVDAGHTTQRLSADAPPQQIAATAATLARQGKWRT